MSPLASSTKMALPRLSSSSGQPSFKTASLRVGHSPRTSSGAMVRFLGQNSAISSSMSCRIPDNSTVVVMSTACSGQSLGSIQIISGWCCSLASDHARRVSRQFWKVGHVVPESYWLWYTLSPSRTSHQTSISNCRTPSSEACTSNGSWVYMYSRVGETMGSMWYEL